MSLESNDSQYDSIQTLNELELTNDFVRRHIGPGPVQVQQNAEGARS